MKIRNLPYEDRLKFKKNVPIYLEFFKKVSPQLSPHSHSMYSRALSYIAVENLLIEKSPKELALELSKYILTTSDFQKIIGKDTESNQNIRLAAFRNLVNPFKEDLQENISSVSYDTLSKLLTRKGTHIRKSILDSKNQNIHEETENLKNKSWKEMQSVLQDYNKKYSMIVNKFLRTNEIPDYVTLRNICIANLYLNNYHRHDEINVHVILRNEYRNAHVWINACAPPQDKNNYFWINFEKNQHFLVIQSSKTVGGVRKSTSKDASLIVQDKRREFKLSSTCVNMILFIKQTFNERTDIPFFKNNVRDGPISSQAWVRTIHKVFEDISKDLTSSTLRKIYFNEIKWEKLTKEQSKYICLNIDNVTLCRDLPKPKKSETPSYSQEQLSSSVVVPTTVDEDGVLIF